MYAIRLLFVSFFILYIYSVLYCGDSPDNTVSEEQKILADNENNEIVKKTYYRNGNIILDYWFFKRADEEHSYSFFVHDYIVGSYYYHKNISAFTSYNIKESGLSIAFFDRKNDIADGIVDEIVILHKQLFYDGFKINNNTITPYTKEEYESALMCPLNSGNTIQFKRDNQ